MFKKVKELFVIFFSSYMKFKLGSFLDTLLINNGKKLEFKVHNKENSKNDYIHFYSNHSNKIKSGFLIVFFAQSPKNFLSQFSK